MGRRKNKCTVNGAKLAQAKSQWQTRSYDQNCSSHQENVLLGEWMSKKHTPIPSVGTWLWPSVATLDASSPLTPNFSILETLKTKSPVCQQPWSRWCLPHSRALAAAATLALLACKLVGPSVQALGVTSPAPWSGSSSSFLNPLMLFLFSFPYAGWRPALMCTIVCLTYPSPCHEMQS